MKNLFFLFLIVISISSFSQESISLKDLEQRSDSLFYLKGQDKTYTGKCIGYFPNKQKKYEVNIKNGERVKIWSQWDKDGMKRFETTYKKNMRNGQGTYWYDYGQVKEQGEFRDNRRVGDWIFWDIYGKISTHHIYKTDIGYFTVSKKEKTIEHEGTFKDGKKELNWIYWDESGNRIKELNYSNGKLNGKAKYWYPNGKYNKIENYNSDVLNGKYLEYYDNGNKRMQAAWFKWTFNGTLHSAFSLGENLNLLIQITIHFND